MAAPGIVYDAVGCRHCQQTGFTGRIPLIEILEADDVLRDAIRSGSAEHTIERRKPEDTLFGHGSIRQDGMVLHDMLLLHVKSPAQSHDTWDLCEIAAVLPAAEAARPITEGGCKLVHA